MNQRGGEMIVHGISGLVCFVDGDMGGWLD